MVTLRYLDRMESIRKSIKIPILKKKQLKKILYSYHSSFVFNKSVFLFFFLKLITPKLNGHFFFNRDNAEYK